MQSPLQQDARNPSQPVSETVVPPHSVRPCDFHAAGRLAEQQARALQNINEELARNLTQSAEAYLGGAFQVTPLPPEQLRYKEFLGTASELSYMLGIEIAGHANGILILDRGLVFPIVDILLGGTGEPEEALRDVTEIEAHIAFGMVKIICQELQTVWKTVVSELRPGTRQPMSQVQCLFPLNEKVVVMKCEVQMRQSNGCLTVILPASLAESVQSKIATDSSTRKLRPSAGSEQRLRDRLMECCFPMELGIPHIKAKLEELLSLAPGKILNLRVPVKPPVALIIGGRQAFEAVPVRKGSHRAAQIVSGIQEAEEPRQIP